MTYRNIYKKDHLANTIRAKQKRQYGAYLFAKQIAAGVHVINLDESVLDNTCYIRKGWGRVGEQLYQSDNFRLNKYNIIAAAASHGRVWFTINNGRNNSATVWNFVLHLCLRLQDEDADWREHTILQWDNATYHKSAWILQKFEAFQIPVMYPGPYAYSAAPVEKIFASIKMRNLNPEGRSFKSR